MHTHSVPQQSCILVSSYRTSVYSVHRKMAYAGESFCQELSHSSDDSGLEFPPPQRQALGMGMNQENEVQFMVHGMSDSKTTAHQSLLGAK